MKMGERATNSPSDTDARLRGGPTSAAAHPRAQSAEATAAKAKPQEEVPPEVMTTVEAARYFRCSRQFLEISRLRGGGPPFSKVGRLVRYRKSSLDAWLAGLERVSTAPKSESA
jgi:excisionase family DNA binding protein